MVIHNEHATNLLKGAIKILDDYDKTDSKQYDSICELIQSAKESIEHPTSDTPTPKQQTESESDRPKDVGDVNVLGPWARPRGYPDFSDLVEEHIVEQNPNLANIKEVPSRYYEEKVDIINDILNDMEHLKDALTSNGLITETEIMTTTKTLRILKCILKMIILEKRVSGLASHLKRATDTITYLRDKQ